MLKPNVPVEVTYQCLFFYAWNSTHCSNWSSFQGADLPKSRFAVALGMTNATPNHQMFWSLTGLLESHLTITSPLNPSILSEVGVTAGSAALVAECRKHDLNDPKYSELGWICTPLAVETYGCWGAEARETLAVETYGCWGAEARETLSRFATRLAIPMRCTKSQATASIYGRLNLTLVRSCARALLSRAGPSLVDSILLL